VVDKFERDKLMNTLEGLEKRLADLGIELETVRSRRLQAQAELRRLSALAEKGDNKAKFAQEPVNKAVAADSTLIIDYESWARD
jgi:predicted  nucleic acid-binding Zn-ribbon protein